MSELRIDPVFDAEFLSLPRVELADAALSAAVAAGASSAFHLSAPSAATTVVASCFTRLSSPYLVCP